MGGEAIDTGTRPAHRGNGDGTLERLGAQHGKSGSPEVATPPVPFGGRAARMAEGVVVLRTPGNAGRGKDPCFWHAFDGEEETAIDATSSNAGEAPDAPEKALREG